MARLNQSSSGRRAPAPERLHATELRQALNRTLDSYGLAHDAGEAVRSLGRRRLRSPEVEDEDEDQPVPDDVFP